MGFQAYAMKKIKLVVSDFHIARGRILEDGSTNYLEDFYYDAEFIEFLEYFSEDDYKKAEVELILNGDFLNTLQVDLREPNPTYLTEALSIGKIRAIIAGHKELFESLSNFARAPGHSITLIPGNHDPAFLWPAARDEFSRFLGVEINYPTPSYRFDGFHIEHGNQYSAINAFQPNNYFIYKNVSEPILNLPWGSLFIIEYLNRVKRARNVVDKVRPLRRYLRWALLNDPLFGWWAIIKLALFFIRTRFIGNPLFETDFRNSLLILKEGFNLVPNLEIAANRILVNHDVHTVIMGHSHLYMHKVFRSDKEYFNTGTWNDIVFLNIENLGKQRRLTFVLIDYPPKSRPRARLMEWKGIHRPIEQVHY